MQNALLIGLSRQTMLERQLDIVSNNIANVNTSGFKADASLFEEYLMSGAHEDNFVGSDRRVSFADAQKLLKEGSNLYSAGQGAAQPDLKSAVRQGFIEKSNVNAVAEMSRMIEVTRAYTQVSTLLQQESDLHKSAIEKLAEVPS